ncbi:hypothetical protein ACIBL8_21460 [Streptomyces sp. NPDC050523]|uniref:hypothetical protein n=1 Tax=Streptomyces sp. NPDC050523 TaxID=3365622 RepID=UPI0037915CE9
MQYVATIAPVHEDGTECTHTGRDKQDTGCAGRRGYRASCTGGGCTWSKTGARASALAEDRSHHLNAHLTASTAR